jgi:hypothetical protein
MKIPLDLHFYLSIYIFIYLFTFLARSAPPLGPNPVAPQARSLLTRRSSHSDDRLVETHRAAGGQSRRNVQTQVHAFGVDQVVQSRPFSARHPAVTPDYSNTGIVRFLLHLDFAT